MNQLAEFLERYCDNQPFNLIERQKIIHQGTDYSDISNSQFIHIAKKEYPQIFIVNDDAIFSKSFLKSFWTNELKIQMSSKELLALLTFVYDGRLNFQNAYKVKHPTDLITNSLIDRFNFTPDDFDPFISGANIAVAAFLCDGIYLFDGNEYSVDDNKLMIQKIVLKHRLIFGIIFHLLQQKNKKSTVSMLAHLINADHFTYNIPKPINYSAIGAEIDLNKSMFNEKEQIGTSTHGYEGWGIDKNDAFSLVDFLKPFKENLKSNRYSYDELLAMPQKDKTGILTCSINAEDFPLAETEEYLKVRDYLKIVAVEDVQEVLEASLRSKDIQNKDRLLHNLAAVYYHSKLIKEFNDESINHFIIQMKSKLSFSFIPLKLSVAKEFEYYLKIELAPLFHLEYYTGNLFYNTISKIINSFPPKII